MSRLIVKHQGRDVSDEIRLCRGRSNPFGWSSYVIVHDRWIAGTQIPLEIGTLYCGTPKVEDPEYTADLLDQEDEG